MTAPWTKGVPSQAGMMLLRTVYRGKVDYWLHARPSAILAMGYTITHWCPVEPPEGCAE